MMILDNLNILRKIISLSLNDPTLYDQKNPVKRSGLMNRDSARVPIFDTTLRDGEQSPGCSMNVQEKARLARQLDRLGVDVIEAGFPIASDGDFAAVQAVAAAVPRPVIAALARAARHDIERAAQALESAIRPRIHVFLATSDIHLPHKLRISRQQA